MSTWRQDRRKTNTAVFCLSQSVSPEARAIALGEVLGPMTSSTRRDVDFVFQVEEPRPKESLDTFNSFALPRYSKRPLEPITVLTLLTTLRVAPLWAKYTSTHWKSWENKLTINIISCLDTTLYKTFRVSKSPNDDNLHFDLKLQIHLEVKMIFLFVTSAMKRASGYISRLAYF